MNAPPVARPRVQSIDIVRGLAMIVMALDHARDYFHYDVTINHDPLDFASTYPFLFFTRWITHFCAPTFVFLSGTSAFLYGQKGRTKGEVSRFLLTRGLWLMALEIGLVSFLWGANYSLIGLQVIWAIGLSMVVLSGLIFLPQPALLALGVVIAAGHNLLDGVRVPGSGAGALLWAVVHRPGLFHVLGEPVMVLYPFLPWLGLMILGYSLGRLFLPEVDGHRRRRFLLSAGAAATALFVVLRGLNIYGDPHPWQRQATLVNTILDFIKTTKYPPSLAYLLMTVGPALVLLGLLEHARGGVLERARVFGRVPLFYYLAHLALLHLLCVLALLASGYHLAEVNQNHDSFVGIPFGCGYPLGAAYLAWAIAVVALYFPCRWYDRYKSSHAYWWLSYV